ncbi:lazarillo protein [Schistocerca serialis cubense]|uniref:lazarillo protein n=1 Tax=Schistocerca serialis cubense TaxID=2023355 RepID=UPI00214EB653|nr:lazarillo protein [Schistocerca serialis cubense]
MIRRGLLSVTAALVVLSVSCSAQETMGCADRSAINDFNATLYMGKWYEYAKMGSMPYEEGGVCVTAEYSMSSNNITVVNSMKDNTTHEVNTTTGWAEFASQLHTDGKLSVHFPNSPSVGNYWILSTDYDNYSIVWSCVKRPDSAASTEISWILLRSRNSSNMTLERVEDELKNLQLDLNKYTKTEQSAKYCAGAEHVVGAMLSVAIASLFALLH